MRQDRFNVDGAPTAALRALVPRSLSIRQSVRTPVHARKHTNKRTFFFSEVDGKNPPGREFAKLRTAFGGNASTANTCQADAFHKSHTEIVHVRACAHYIRAHVSSPPVPHLEVTSIYLSCVVTCANTHVCSSSCGTHTAARCSTSSPPANPP